MPFAKNTSRALLLGSALILASCAGGGSTLTPPMADTSEVVPYSPGQYTLAVATAPATARTSDQAIAEGRYSAMLGDPSRAALRLDSGRRSQNVTVSGSSSAVGTWVPHIPGLQGVVVNMGVQLHYHVTAGGNFFHTHSGPCVEFGVNYASEDPTLFGYNWCSGSNRPLAWINAGLVGDPGGVLDTWSSTGNGSLIAWDSVMGQYKISIEEILEKDGWHILAYNWATARFVDIMNGMGVTGTQPSGGWDVFEEHVAYGTSCAFDSTFPVGSHLLYDEKKQVMMNGSWRTLDKVPGVTSKLTMDCADISGHNDPGYASPFFSGQYFSTPTMSAFGAQKAGDFWLTQR
jgi:hypothetical protein